MSAQDTQTMIWYETTCKDTGQIQHQDWSDIFNDTIVDLLDMTVMTM